MGRAPCCDKATVKKGPWSPEEDSKLRDYIHQHGTGGNWIALPHKAGLKRCGKSCRLRWLNYLRPDIKHGEFSLEEDRIICNLFATIGSRYYNRQPLLPNSFVFFSKKKYRSHRSIYIGESCYRWSIIAAQLPGRTDNDIKNYWNTKLKKKLITGMVPPSHQRFVHRCAAAAVVLNQSPPPPPFMSASSPSTTLFSSSQRMPPPLPTLYIQNSCVSSCDCNTLTFSQAPLPTVSSSSSSSVIHRGGGGCVATAATGNECQRSWWEAPLEYGLEDIKQMIIGGGNDVGVCGGGGGVQGDENKAAEGMAYL